MGNAPNTTAGDNPHPHETDANLSSGQPVDPPTVPRRGPVRQPEGLRNMGTVLVVDDIAGNCRLIADRSPRFSTGSACLTEWWRQDATGTAEGAPR